MIEQHIQSINIQVIKIGKINTAKISKNHNTNGLIKINYQVYKIQPKQQNPMVDSF